MNEFSDIWLKLSYWSLSHKNDLKKWWVIILLAADIFMVVFIVTNFAIYIISMPRESRLMTQMVENQAGYQEYRITGQPQPLDFAEPELISTGSDQADLIVKVRNPNKNWAAGSIKYKFVVNEKETEVEENFIMPDEEKYLTAFSVAKSGSSFNISFITNAITWQRVKDLQKFPQANFKIENIQYTQLSVPERNITVGQVKAQITNDSIYSYWRTDFMAVLLSGNRVVGVSKLIFDEFKSFEKRNIEFRFLSAPSSVSKVSIYPEVNLLDTDNFMK